MSDTQHDDIEDLDACARAGRTPRDAARYRVLVGDGLLRYEPVVIDGAQHTGRSLREHATLLPPDAHVLFAVRSDGLLEEIRLDEPVDLRADVAKFLAFRNDRIFRFLLDGHEFQWGGPYISGATLLRLAGLDLPTHTVSHHRPEGAHQLAQSDLVNLGDPGVEMFVTASVG